MAELAVDNGGLGGTAETIAAPQGVCKQEPEPQAEEVMDSYVDPQAPTEPVTSSDERKLFIGGLALDTNTESLRTFFETFGPVEELDLKMKYDDPEHPTHKGFAFVTMSNLKSVEDILGGQACKRHQIDNKFVECKKALSHSEYQARKNRTKKVFVGGVPTDFGEEILQEYFKQYGEIDEVVIVRQKDDHTKRRGFVFITYKTFESVDKCTAENFHTIEGYKVEVKRAQPREQSSNNWGRGYSRGGGMPGRGGGGYVPYGVGGGGGYGGYSEPYYDNYDHGFHGPPGRGGWGSRYGPMKGNPHASRFYHPYGR